MKVHARAPAPRTDRVGALTVLVPAKLVTPVRLAPVARAGILITALLAFLMFVHRIFKILIRVAVRLMARARKLVRAQARVMALGERVLVQLVTLVRLARAARLDITITEQLVFQMCAHLTP
jgi:hypothetical protein